MLKVFTSMIPMIPIVGWIHTKVSCTGSNKKVLQGIGECRVRDDGGATAIATARGGLEHGYKLVEQEGAG